MTDSTALLEAALHAQPEGIALLGSAGEVRFWNQAAEAITGYTGTELIGQPVPDLLEPLLLGGCGYGDTRAAHVARGARIEVRHKLGHQIPAIARILVLRDELGQRIGTAAVFHPAESLDALPHGDNQEGYNVAASQSSLEERLRAEFDDFEHGGPPFGVLWVAVDQAAKLRKTHGAAACEAMLAKVEQALAQGLRPAEELGRWGDDEFLVISHERTAQMLARHAQALASLARTADFRWWGDRVSLSVSIGAAQAGSEEALPALLERARGAMLASIREGGNRITTAQIAAAQITAAQGEQTCLPS